MSRRHAARRRQRGAQLDGTRRTRIFSRWAEQPFRHTWWVGQDLRPQRPLYRMRARERMRRASKLIVRLSVDLSGLPPAIARAAESILRFGEAMQAADRALRITFLREFMPTAVEAVERRGGRPSTYRYVADRLAEGMSLERALEYLDAGVPDEMARVWNNLRS
jgi:hypothetical protein